MSTRYTYLFVRDDMPVEHQIVQAAHAAHQAGETLGTHSHIVLLSAKDEQFLLRQADRLSDQCIKYTMFYDSDHGSHTALCTEPLMGTQRDIMKRYRLKRPSQCCNC